MSLRPILFVDRDGTLIEEPEDFQIDAYEKLRFVEGVIPAMLKLRDAGYAFAIVSNQDGLGSAAYPQADFDGPHALMRQIFASQGIDAVSKNRTLWHVGDYLAAGYRLAEQNHVSVYQHDFDGGAAFYGLVWLDFRPGWILCRVRLAHRQPTQ